MTSFRPLKEHVFGVLKLRPAQAGLQFIGNGTFIQQDVRQCQKPQNQVCLRLTDNSVRLWSKKWGDLGVQFTQWTPRNETWNLERVQRIERGKFKVVKDKEEMLMCPVNNTEVLICAKWNRNCQNSLEGSSVS